MVEERVDARIIYFSNLTSDQEREIILQDKQSACDKTITRNTRQNEQDYKNKGEEAHEIFTKKEKESIV